MKVKVMCRKLHSYTKCYDKLNVPYLTTCVNYISSL